MMVAQVQSAISSRLQEADEIAYWLINWHIIESILDLFVDNSDAEYNRRWFIAIIFVL